MRATETWIDFVTFGMSKSQIQGAIVMGWRIAIIGHVLWACGLLSYIGLGNGFALASDQKNVSEEVRESRLEYINGRLFELRVQQCTAIKNNRSALMYTLQIRGLIESRSKLTDEPLALPTCQEL